MNASCLENVIGPAEKKSKTKKQKQNKSKQQKQFAAAYREQ
jgi:hypothetical protein